MMALVLKVAGNVDSWCGRCKLMLAHTIEAMVGSEVARVHCNTCNTQHAYKPFPPGEAPKQVRAREESGRGLTAGKVRASHYQELLKGRDPAMAKRYSPKETFKAGDVVEHVTFGIGVATALKEGGKIEVLFQDGAKVLVHGK